MRQASLNDYGSLESMIRGIRAERPLDLNASNWRTAHTGAPFSTWQSLARDCLHSALHYSPQRGALEAETLAREERDGFVLETVAFNATATQRLEGYFLLPTGAAWPAPAVLAMHAWGGPMLFGKERIVNSGRDHPLLKEHRDIYYGGAYFAEELARNGYCVLVIDAFHFGKRIPRGLNGIPREIDPFKLSIDELLHFERLVHSQLFLGVRQLNWAGTTWMGINYWDDSRCVDYLESRPEVDNTRMGCTGLSGGGWRTMFLAALDARIKAAVNCCWMTTGDHQQAYNVDGAIGTFCLLPGVWNRMDVPDLTIMSAPCASMVVSTRRDEMFPVEGQNEAARQIALGYEWAGVSENFVHHTPDKGHVCDLEIQAEALAWFDRHLKA